MHAAEWVTHQSTSKEVGSSGGQQSTNQAARDEAGRGEQAEIKMQAAAEKQRQHRLSASSQILGRQQSKGRNAQSSSRGGKSSTARQQTGGWHKAAKATQASPAIIGQTAKQQGAGITAHTRQGTQGAGSMRSR